MLLLHFLLNKNHKGSVQIAILQWSHLKKPNKGSATRTRGDEHKQTSFNIHTALNWNIFYVLAYLNSYGICEFIKAHSYHHETHEVNIA